MADKRLTSVWLSVARAIPAFFISFTLCSASMFDEDVEQRLRIGLSLFRSLLASDLNLSGKTNRNNQLILLVIHQNNTTHVQSVVEQLANSGRGKNKGKIRNLPIKVEMATESFFSQYQEDVPAGIYIAEDLSDDTLQAITDYGIAHHIIVYSPFDGHVQKGILGGLNIGIRVQPSINLKTLEKSGLHIKALFLEIAKTYE